MSTLREPIIAGFVTAMAAVSGLYVFRSRDAALARGELPAVVVQPEEEVVEFPSAGLAVRRLTVLFSVMVRADPVDQAADAYLQQIHAAVMKDPTLNGTVGRTVERSTKWTIETGDVTGLAAEIRYEVTYQTRATDLSAH